MEQKGKIDKIRELNERLYQKTDMVPRKHIGAFTQKGYGVTKTWAPPVLKESSKTQLPQSMFKKFFIFSIGFFVLALGVAAFIFYRGNTMVSTKNIEISILGNAFANGGEELPLQVEITNKNTTALEAVDLVLEYPKGSGDQADTVRIRNALGTIGAGDSSDITIPVVLFGEQGSVKTIRASIQYRLQGSNSIFVKETTYDVTINQAPLVLSVDAPTEVTPGQTITLNIKSTLNAEKEAKDILIRVEYPPGFQFVSAEPKPTYGNNIWSLGDLPQGSVRDIALTGVVLGENDEERTFHVYAGEAGKALQRDIGVVYNSLLHTIVLKRPFLEAKLALNGAIQDAYSVTSGATVRGEVKWSNNLPNRILNAEIRVKIDGVLYDEESLSQIGGFYDSLNNEIVWNQSTTEGFKEIAPNDTGSFSFTFKTKSLVGEAPSVQNQEITVAVSIKGLEAGQEGIPVEVTSYETKKVRIASDFQVAVGTLFASGPYQNTGSIPPRKDQETTYTLSFKVTNSTNQIKDAYIRTTLPPNVRFIKGSKNTISYTEGSREVKILLGTIEPNTGLGGVTQEYFVQVALIPSSAQIGQVAPLTTAVTLTGLDTFANTILETTRQALTTRLSNDPQGGPGSEKVGE